MTTIEDGLAADEVRLKDTSGSVDLSSSLACDTSTLLPSITVIPLSVCFERGRFVTQGG